MLLETEKVAADAGYRGEPKIMIPYHFKETPQEYPIANARACHEQINGCFKKWKVLGEVFCHDSNKHGICFHAVAAITQLELATGAYSPFEVNTYDQPLEL